ncbi:MAG: hypothetical protein M0006_15400 [Magnetospirillum sp.]|nr:hypothetical protein [Magnetospirillum sp.]
MNRHQITTVTAAVRFRLDKGGMILNHEEISRRLGVDISTGDCAWSHRGGGWYRLDADLSDPLRPWPAQQ